MSNFKKISEQRGTLLVEAIAMLGLIALVTPTLYKKSAERLQEIQDINTASQARTMYSIVETFMKTHYSLLMEATGNADGSTVAVGYADGGSSCAANLNAPCFEKGYSTFVPFGYVPGDLKNYTTPNVYVHRDNESLVSYIVFPAISSSEIGKKRAARVASLVGANGGVVSRPFSGSSTSSEIYGTGGAWRLDNDMLDEIKMDDNMVENSLVVTSPEPVSLSAMDSEKFLYRVPSEAVDSVFHNTMVTDLYLGGHPEDKTSWQDRSKEYYSVFNVRKLTLNTNCQHNRDIEHSTSVDSEDNYCNPNVADLYIGKPNGQFLEGSRFDNGISGNTGAAWIYGNLSALNENFRLFREGDDEGSVDRLKGHDVMEFVRRDEETGGDSFSVFRVENGGGNGSSDTVNNSHARISLMNDFVQVFESGSGSSGTGNYEFMLGHSSLVGGESGFIHASMDGSTQVLELNTKQGLETEKAAQLLTRINGSGGTVIINSGASTNTQMNTIINEMGGRLTAGYHEGWLEATNSGNSSKVIILKNDTTESSSTDKREFLVGGQNELDSPTMIYGKNDRVSLRGGLLRVHTNLPFHAGDSDEENNTLGGWDMLKSIYEHTGEYNAHKDLIGSSLTGETAIVSRYTDILGNTHIGAASINRWDSSHTSSLYQRKDWQLTVAGSAWIDDTLFAENAVFNKAGVAEFHAGFSSYDDYAYHKHDSWLNVYDDRFIVRDRQRSNDNIGTDDSTSVMIYADSSEIILRDLQGASLNMSQGTARLGTNNDYIYVDNSEGGSSSVNVIGSSLANIYTTSDDHKGIVNLQQNALQLVGQPVDGNGEVYSNEIRARAKKVMVKTSGDGDVNADNAQFYIGDDDGVRTRYVNVTVENSESSAIFKVMPDMGDGSSDANVMVHGTLHVDDNDVIHIASNSLNRASLEESENRAMLEIDPEYVQIWAKNGTGYATHGTAGGGDTDAPYYAMLKINPSDIGGGSSATADTGNASVYVRRGAIELEKSEEGLFGADAKIGADQGVGYIKANRFVSNTGETVPAPTTITAANDGRGEMAHAYDQFMVNPAYTSVMHDIKLTTRGGARLSDALPDFVLKGVYNLVNNCTEGEHSSLCSGSDQNRWASPYIGLVPYASCPRGYRNMATVVPISFNIGQSGQLIDASKLNKSGGTGIGWVVNPYQRQAQIISVAKSGKAIAYPTYGKVEGYNAYSVYEDNTVGNTHGGFGVSTTKRPEGWFMGFDAQYTDATHESTTSQMETIDDVSTPYDDFHPWQYAKSGNDWKVVAEPLYFQQNNFLKTTVDPQSGGKGWNAYMGFIYDTSIWGNAGNNSPIRSNYDTDGDGSNEESGGTSMNDKYAWNVFPIPTNTIEGHATVYCYFDRKNFNAWGDLIDKRDARDLLKEGASGNEFDRLKKDPDYIKRLNDPSLKYDDPW